MTQASDAIAETPQAAGPQPAAPLRPTRPFYWSVRRELWEHRAIFGVPLIAAAVVLVGFAISCAGIAHRRPQTLTLPTDKQALLIGLPYAIGAVVILVTVTLLALFYCLNAIYGERRDRSILFWKSLPVSDLQAVLAKAVVPFAILPVVAFFVILVMQGLMYLLQSAILMGGGVTAATPWTLGDIASGPVVLAYGLVTQTLWLAPLYGWVLLVSAWAKRAPFLWAVLPPMAIGVFEHIAFNRGYISSLLFGRLSGGFEAAFVVPTKESLAASGHIPRVGLDQIDVGKFLSSPGLWVGLVVATGFIAAAIWFRRRRDAI